MTHDQLAIAADAMHAAHTYAGKACDKLVRDESADTAIHLTKGYIIEAAEALGMTVTEARQ